MKTSWLVSRKDGGTLQIAAVGGGFAADGASEYYARRFPSLVAAERYITRMGLEGCVARQLDAERNRGPVVERARVTACWMPGGAR